MVLMLNTMERTKRNIIKENKNSIGCLGRICIGFSCALLLFLFLGLIATDGFFKVDNLGGGYYVIGEVGDYDIEYQYHYLGSLNSLQIPGAKSVFTTKEWITVKTENDEYWAIDKTKKPAFRYIVNEGIRYKVLEDTPQVLTGPMDSLQFSKFSNEHNIHSFPQKIVYYHTDISSNYCLVEHDRETWYLAYQSQRTTRFKSGRYTIIHPSPVYKLGYEYDTNLIFCKTKDDTYWIINGNHKPQKDNNPVDSLTYYAELEKCKRITILAIPSQTGHIKKLRRDR